MEAVIEALTPKGSPPEAAAPRAKTPEAKTPKAAAPEAAAPEAKTPEAKTPEAKTPDEPLPKAAAPEAKTPEEAVPKAAVPEAPAPKPVALKDSKVLPKDPKVKRRPNPKNSATFFRARAKYTNYFTYTPEGNLMVPEIDGKPSRIIEVPRYRPATVMEIREKEDELRDKLLIVEREFDETASLLKQAMVTWRRTGAVHEAIVLQRKMVQLDGQRTLLRSPARWVHPLKGLDIRDVLMENQRETKKMPYPVSAMRLRSIGFEDTVKIRMPGDEPVPVVVVEVPSEQEAEETFVFFDNPAEPEHGALSPETLVEFIFNSTKYTSLVQAYETERVTKLGRQDLRPGLLKTRSPKTIKMMAAKVVGDVEKPRDLWTEILKALINQHPRFAETLRDTGDDTLVYASAKDGKWGIGLPASDPLAMSKETWKGENWLGQAWQAVREGLPPLEGESEAEEEGENALTGGGYTEHGLTKKEAQVTRGKVLMGHYRRRA